MENEKDVKPKNGEYFNTIKYVLEDASCCFICGREIKNWGNLSAYVKTHESGKRIAEMFNKEVLIDFKESEPNSVQVKVGTCAEHIYHLILLNKLIKVNGGVINKTIVNIVTKISGNLSDKHLEFSLLYGNESVERFLKEIVDKCNLLESNGETAPDEKWIETWIETLEDKIISSN
jgi:hypothetical protein